jgi:tRNA G46 methylase TrmB
MFATEAPELAFLPIEPSNSMDATALKLRKDRELNNGRLAMIGITSFLCAKFIPGSVPVLSGLDAF